MAWSSQHSLGVLCAIAPLFKVFAMNPLLQKTVAITPRKINIAIGFLISVCCKSWIDYQYCPESHALNRFNRSALRTTEIEEKAMAAAENIGLSNPNAATGIPTEL